MKNIFQNLVTEEEYKRTKRILYEIRTIRGCKDYDFFKRVLYVAASFSGLYTFVDYDYTLNSICRWLEHRRHEKAIFYADIVHRRGGYYFGVEVETLVNGNWNTLMNEVVIGREKYLRKEMIVSQR